VDGIYRIPPTVAEPPRDRGIVGEIIGQFADPFAFFRELVQNAIDAGTPAVEIQIEHAAEHEVARVAVRDQGDGMTRDTIENQLLVLFRSTKEHDDTKIGKFGIGFASVLAPGPNVVVVNSSRDGRRHTLHLQRDLSYELFDAGPSTRPGTTVELEIPLTSQAGAGAPRSWAFDAFVSASEAALVRWCRHAAVPIHLVARAGGTTVTDVRIDRPLGLENAVVEVRATSADGQITAVVGLTPDAAGYGGFFDHGLTLYEDTEPPTGRIAFKVQDARLAHTMSRDNVRRDDAYERAVDFVTAVARGQLPTATAGAIRAAADAGDLLEYSTLCHASIAAGVRIDRDALTVPLIEAVAGSRAATFDQLGSSPFGARQRTPITTMLVAAGVPVVHLGGDGVTELAPLLQIWLGATVTEVDRELTRVVPVTLADSDHALLALTGELIEAAHRRPGALLLAELDGALASNLAITGDRSDAAYLVDDDDPAAAWLIRRRLAGRKPFGWLTRAPVVISANHLAVESARRVAVTDPVAAAAALARLLLLGAGLLDVERSSRLMTATLAALGLGAKT
jgi:molecular chaperone HtpG